MNDLTVYGTMSLGGLINALAKLPKQDRDVYLRWRPDDVYDRWFLHPTTLDSYRGYYDHLALGWAENVDEDMRSVASLVERLRAADGERFTGWKGGTYRMNLETPVWADNCGKGAGVQIVGVRDDDWCVRLLTSVED